MSGCFVFFRSLLRATLVVVSVNAIPIGTCGYFGSDKRLYHVMDYAAKIAYERGFLKPASTNFSIELYPVDTKCNGGFASGASLPLFAGVGEREGAFYPGAGESDAPPVVAISGCGCSGSSGSVATLGGSFTVPVVSGAATSPSLSNKDVYGYFSRVVPTDSMQSLALAKIIQSNGWQRVYGFSSAEKYGMGLSDALSIALRKAGIEYVPKIVPFSKQEAFDHSGIVEAIERSVAEQSGQQRVFVVLAQGYVAMAVLRELDARGFIRPETAVLVPESVCDEPTLDFTGTVAGYAAQYPEVPYWKDGYDWYKLFAKLDGLVCVQPQARGPLYASEEFKSFFTSLTLADFNAAGMPSWMHNEQGWYADFLMLDTKVYYPLIFDALSSIIYAIGSLKAKGVDTPAVSGELLLEAIRDVKFEGLSGSVGLDTKGDRLAPYSVMNLQGVNLVKVGTYDSSQDALVMSLPVVFFGGATTAPSSRPVPCAAGEQPSQDGFGCDPCPPGTANKIPGAQACIPCNRGFYSDTLGGAQQCSLCPAGTDQPLEGQTNCTACNPGFFSAKEGVSVCQACSPGFHMEEVGAIQCSACPVGTFQTTLGGQTCDACDVRPTTVTPGSSSPEDCVCEERTFLHGDVCLPCDEGLECKLGRPPRVRPGFYMQGLDRGSFRCKPGVCPGGEVGACGRGMAGIACGRCLDEWYADGLECFPCAGGSAGLLVVVLLGVAAALGAMTVALAQDPKSVAITTLSSGILIGMCFTMVQVLQAFAMLSLDWGTPFEDILELVSRVFALDFLHGGCIFGAASLGRYLQKIVAFPAILAMHGAIVALFCAGSKRFAPHLQTNLSLWTNGAGTIGLLFFISLAVVSAQPFDCILHPGSSHTVAVFMDVECASSAHSELVGAGGFALAEVVCTFCLFAVIIWLYPTWVVRSNNVYLQRVRFIVMRFQPRMYYFAIFILLRNLVLAFTPVMAEFAGLQVLLMGFVVLLYDYIQAMWWPWRYRILNLADRFLSCAIVTILLVSGVFVPWDHKQREGSLQSLRIILLLVVVLLFVHLLACVALLSYRKGRKKYSLFISHYKMDAGATARWMKLVLGQTCGDDSRIFIDSDNLDDLDTLLVTVQTDVARVLLLLTEDTLWRPWCAGEICMAMAHGVPITVVTLSPGAERVLENAADSVAERIPASSVEFLQPFSMDLDDVERYYAKLPEMKRHTLDISQPLPLLLNRVTNLGKDIHVKASVLRRSPTATSSQKEAYRRSSMVQATDATILLNRDSMEAISMSRIATSMLQASRMLVYNTAEVPADAGVVVLGPGPTVFVLLSHGALQKGAVCAGIVTGMRDNRTLIPIVLDGMGFAFFSQVEWKSIEDGSFFSKMEWMVAEGVCPGLTSKEVADAYRQLFKIIAPRLSPHAGIEVIQGQCARVMVTLEKVGRGTVARGLKKSTKDSAASTSTLSQSSQSQEEDGHPDVTV